jgi:hypothetical protein
MDTCPDCGALPCDWVDVPTEWPDPSRVLGEPNEILTHDEHGPFLEKWHLSRGDDGSARLFHRFLRSDADGEFHDHPWDNSTLVIAGGYWEVTQTGRRWLGPGAFVERRATDFHRVQLEPDVFPLTLFCHGPKINEWGFLLACGDKVGWREFTEGTGSFRVTRDRDTTPRRPEGAEAEG